MQKWTSLLALALMVGCAATPSDPGTFRLEAANAPSDDKHVQQVFATPTPTPVTTLDPNEVSKSNKLLDLTVRELAAAEKEVRTRLQKEKDRALNVFFVPDPETGLVATPASLRYYERGIDGSVTTMGNNFQLVNDNLAAVRGQDLATVKKAIVKAKTNWYGIRSTAERQALVYRKYLAAHYAQVQKARRKRMRAR